MHIAMQTFRQRIKVLAFGLTLAGMVLANMASVAAADITNASLELSDPRPGETGVIYTFNGSSFTTGTTIRCVTLEVNDAADMSSAVPTGIDTTGFTLDSSTLITSGSWTTDGAVNGMVEITNAAGQTPAASGNLVYGGIDNGSSDGVTYFAEVNTYTNVDCSTGGPVDSVTVAYVYIDGELVELTIEPTLTFTCTGLPATTSVNGTSTTLTNTCTGIDFGNDVTTSANGIAGHNLNVSTNAQAGYTVYLRHTGLLTNESSDTITNHSGTNASPSAFPAAGTEAWGYTTEDATLGGGTADRFTTGGGFAGFTTTNEEVMDNLNATPGAGDNNEIAVQVGVASSTEAGTYQSTVIYTLVATF
jgi:hypothetical protein